MVRKRHKTRIMLEYWNSISDVCFYLKLNKKKEMVQKYKGHKFIKIHREIKMQVIRDYIRAKEKEYCDYKVSFLKKVSQI